MKTKEQYRTYMREYMRKWLAKPENRAKWKIKQKKYREKNPQKWKRYNEKWRKNNKERVRLGHLKWKQNNLEKYITYQKNYQKAYRAKKRKEINESTT